MKKVVELFQLLTQLGIACSVDLTNGIFIAVWLSQRFGVELSILTVVVAILMSVSPDADFLIGRHDESHKPLLFIGPLVVLAILMSVTRLSFLSFWFWMWAICVFTHLVHDSIGNDNSGGVAWGWPINKLFVTFLLSNRLLKNHQNERAKVLIFAPHTREDLVDNSGDIFAWLKLYYAKITPAMLWSLGYSSIVVILAAWLLV